MTNGNYYKARNNPKRRPAILLPQNALLTHMRILGGMGSGKSRLAARGPAFDHIRQGKSVFCMDPSGGIFENVIDKMRRYPPAVQAILWNRIIYVDMGATDYVVPMPLYYRLNDTESLMTIARRPINTFLTLDPALAGASIEGLNALSTIGTYAGMIICAIGDLKYQISEVADFIRHPERWSHLFAPALERFPELADAVDFFQEYAALTNESLRARKSNSFLTKLIPILNDPTNRAMFCSAENHLDFDEISQQGKSVFFDFSSVLDPEIKQLKMIVVFHRLLEHVKSRGLSGRTGGPIFMVIDEINNLQGRSTENPVLADEISELVTVYARANSVGLCMLHQNLGQLDPRIQSALSMLGTQVIGAVQDPADALTLARQLTRYDPYLVKKTEPVFQSTESRSTGTSESYNFYYLGGGEGSRGQEESHTTTTYEQVFERTTEFTIDEQTQVMADLIRTIPKFQFLLRPSLREGDVTGRLRRVSIENLDKGMYPDEASVKYARQRLRQKWGNPIDDILEDITDRLSTPPLMISDILAANEQYRDLQAAGEEEDDYRYDEFEEYEEIPAGAKSAG